MASNLTQTRKPTGARKPSKASMARALAQVHAQHAEQRELPAALGQLIEAYAPSGFTALQLVALRLFLRTVITASTLRGAESVRKHCTHVAALAAYAIGRGVTLTPATVMTTAFIDDYVRLGMTGAGDTVRAERRRRLLALARTVNPGPTTPARLTPIGHSSIKPPYTPAELAVITRVSRTQPTPARRRDLSAVVALGAGAGLDSIDLRHLHVGHIEDDGPQGLLVHVQGPRPRIVPVRAPLEGLLRSAVDGRRSGELVLGDKVDRRNTAARAVDNAALYNVAHIEAARLRATWLADLMTDTIPIGLLLQAAGLKSARTLVDLMEHLGPWLEHKGLTTPTTDTASTTAALRGGTR